MSERLSREVRNIRAQADVVARAAGRPTGTVHYLVAMFVVDCKARDILLETKIDDRVVLDTYERMAVREDAPEALAEVNRQTTKLTESAELPEANSMVLLASLLRVRDSLAFKVLEKAGVNVPGLRSRVIGLVGFVQDRMATGQIAVQRPNDTQRMPQVTQPPRPAQPNLQAPQKTVPLPLRVPIQPPPAAAPAAKTATPPAAPAQQATQLPLPSQVFQLKADQFPVLCEVGRNLTELALAGRIDPVIGRDAVIEQVIDVLLMRYGNNPCLIGEAGVGKTAVAHGLAARLAGHPDQYGRLGTAVIVEIATSALLAGTGLRGAFSERMRKLRDEVQKADGQVIVFMDEIHTIMGAGTGDGPLDAANDLKSALARGTFPLIGATTRAEYKRHIEADPAMDRRFQVVDVAEPTVPEALQILAGIAPVFGRHHGVTYAHDALTSAVHLSKRFITDRHLPDKAIAVLDRAGAQARRGGRLHVQVDDVARAVHTLTGTPMERLLADERGRIRDLAGDLKGKIIGHDGAMDKIAKRIQRNYAGFSGDKPVASFLFAGAAGVGKTETAKALAELLFVSADALVRFDMSDYAEAHAISKLLGSPPGYVGHQQAGLLAQAMQKRPYRVILFDEIDRAAGEVQAVLVQLLETGRTTDNHGHTIDVRNSILIFTTNAGADVMAGPRRKSIGFGAIDAHPLAELLPPGDDAATMALDQAVMDKVAAAITPELHRRMDETIVLRPLSLASARKVARREIDHSAARLYESKLIEFVADDAVVDLVLQGGLDPATGARPLRSRIETVLEAFLTECILSGALRPSMRVVVTSVGGQLQLQQATSPVAVAMAN